MMATYEGFLGCTVIYPQGDTGTDPFIACITFDNLVHLMSYVRSDRRRELMLELEPLLEGTLRSAV